MFENPSRPLMVALRDFVFRHEVVVEAREFHDGRFFVRRPTGRSRRFGPRPELRSIPPAQETPSYVCAARQTMSGYRSGSTSPEKALVRPVEAAIQYEECGRDIKRYSARFHNDVEAGSALFGYVRSESRLLERLLDDTASRELLRIGRRHRRTLPSRRTRRRIRGKQRRRR